MADLKPTAKKKRTKKENLEATKKPEKPQAPAEAEQESATPGAREVAVQRGNTDIVTIQLLNEINIKLTQLIYLLDARLPKKGEEPEKVLLTEEK